MAKDRLTKGENVELYLALMTGDVSARDKLILGNKGLVVYRVESLLQSLPSATYLIDDLVSEGLLQLVIEVDSFIRRKPLKPDNVTAYLGLAITRRLKRFLDQENVIRVPDRTKRRVRQDGEEIEIPVHVPLDTAESKGKLDPELALVELRDVIAACCENDLERALVRFAPRCDTNQELADALEIPKTSMFRIRKAIYARFIEKTGMSPEPLHQRRKKRKKQRKCSVSKESASISMAC